MSPGLLFSVAATHPPYCEFPVAYTRIKRAEHIHTHKTAKELLVNRAILCGGFLLERITHLEDSRWKPKGIVAFGVVIALKYSILCTIKKQL